jgi:hypothetical protein
MRIRWARLFQPLPSFPACPARRVGIRFVTVLPGSVTVAQQVLVVSTPFSGNAEILGNCRVKRTFRRCLKAPQNTPETPGAGVSDTRSI